MSNLTEMETKSLQLRFGINGNNRMTLREIRDIFELTRARIRPIESY